ncbi:hypothetical protein S7711_10311 [Stachybotrys chartarum IBT 7711]|uniref:Uncharacterized protein n=1 Tax=Stachybotrys chartarum (strain CBS 109288 / IBT 7711) TaxID=1280523 RepID=A0A084B5Y8_STACB|nr:hypothetical protein S7711_10311 [Stachybotrys chartarum IBT 7711]
MARSLTPKTLPPKRCPSQEKKALQRPCTAFSGSLEGLSTDIATQSRDYVFKILQLADNNILKI